MRSRYLAAALAAVSGAILSAPASAADFNYNVQATSFTSYTINGASNPTLTLARGLTYTFQVAATGHPFFIKTAQVTGSGSTWDAGVTNNGTENGTVTFQVPNDAPTRLFYICGIHLAMTGTILIPAPPVPATRPAFLAVFAAITLAVTALWLRRGRAAGGARAAQTMSVR